jgi:hypothetical protein
MKNQQSDFEKNAIKTWSVLGFIGGTLFSLILNAPSVVMGILGLLAGAAVGYGLVRTPRRKIHKTGSHNSRWRSDALSEHAMKKIYQAYNIPEESASDEEESDDYEPEVRASDDPLFDKEESPDFWGGFPATSKVLIFLGALWPLIFYALLRLVPNLFAPIEGTSVLKLLLLLPSCVMAILNGAFLLSRQNTEDALEESPNRNAERILGILSLALGVGLGAYLIFKNVL